MPRERTFWVLLAILLVAAWGATFLEDRSPRSVTVGLATEAPTFLSQAAGGRTFRPARFALLASLPAGSPGAPLALPTIVKADARGDAYVLDSGTGRVVRLGAEGKTLQTYGPDGLGNPSDIAVTGAGELWIADPDGRRITVFDPQGGKRTIELREPVYRLAPAEPRVGEPRAPGFVATLFNTHGETLFHRFSPRGERQGSFGRFFPSEYQSALTGDGWLVPAGDLGFLYLFRHAGLLASYGEDGRPRYFRKTIVPLPLPALHIDVGGNQTFSTSSPLAAISGSLVGPELYVLAGDLGPKARVLDVYEAATGTYRYSLQPPETDARYAVLAPGRLWSVGPRGVAVYGWEPALGTSGDTPAG
ncbi:MAG TPA: hypothetical protein VMM92_11515 [Thermoanaerobaculia bacterium]|nr:hypothetical protein [Thermoanaerobaculia bacterium]